MKCPRCGSEMTLDDHRKIPLEMCYNCGYIEGQGVETEKKSATNFEHMKDLNLNELGHTRISFHMASTPPIRRI